MIFQNHYRIIKKSGLFDERYYLTTYEDVRKADIDPIKHYLKYGWEEGRNPSEQFDTNFYLNNNLDVKQVRMNPLYHFIKYGWRERRKFCQNNNIKLQPNISNLQKFFLALHFAKNTTNFVKKLIIHLKTIGLKKTIIKINEKVCKIHNEILPVMNHEKYLNKFTLKNINKSIDIIIPIYNGYDFVIDCFDSILNHTNLTIHRLILVDDCSTEDSLINFYNTLIDKKYKKLNIVLLQNSQNLGFIGSVNHGMEFDNKNDVILLNSDTVVTKNWVEKMIQAAYSRNNIGTVTALSNNATLCSIPNQWQDNKIPDGLTVDEYAEFVEFISPCEYPEIPSPVGFCMYIKRECIQKLGYFDTIYGKGYAEENDFGMRLHINGYRHVCDDTTFIHHKGSMTFGNNPEKLDKIKKNADILYNRYPQLKDLLINFEQDNTMRHLYDILQITLKIKTGKGILFINVAPLNKFPSGALKHQLDLIEYFKKDYLFMNLYSENSCDLYLEIFERSNYFNFYCGSYQWKNFDFTKGELNNFLKLLIKNFSIKIIHFQTPQHFPLSLIETAKEEASKVIFTLHDFLLFCPNYTLINQYTQFCNFEQNLNACEQCLNNTISLNSKIDSSVLMKRKHYIKNILCNVVDLFISPSQSHKNLIVRNLDFQQIEEDKIKTIPHPFKLNKFNPIKENIKNLNIAFIGNFTDIKGSTYFKEIVLNLLHLSEINWYIIGKVHDWESYDTLYGRQNVTFYGEYKYDDISSIIKKYGINIAINLSKCCESYSYTLTEAFTNRVLTISSKHGAVNERIAANDYLGWIVKDDNLIENISKLIQYLNSNKDLIDQKLVDLHQNLTMESFDEYEKIYSQGTL